jgi:hypothetical protein
MSGGFDKGFSISPLAGGGGGGGGVPLNFSQTKGSQVTVTVAEAKPATVVSTTITTQGNPVQIIVAGDANPSAAGGWGLLNIYRGGTAVGQLVQFESSSANENVPYCLQVVDQPAAGTWTYSLRVTTVSADTQFGEAAGPIITVTELGAEAAGGGGVTAVTAASPLASSGGTTPVISLTAGTTSGDVLTWDGANWSGAAPTGGGTIGGTIETNQIAYGTAANTVSGSGDFTYDGTTLAINSSGPSALTVASTFDGQFLDVNTSLYSITLTDPLTPTNSLTLGPSDVGLGDGSVSANMYAGEVSATDNGTTNKISISALGGEATLKADDSAGALVELHLSASSITVQSTAASGDFLVADASIQRLTVVDPGTGVDSAYLEGGRVTVDAAGNTVSLDAFTVPTITTLNVGSSLPMPLNLAIEALQINGASGNTGEVLTSNGPGLAPTWQAGGGGGASFAGALTVYVDAVSGSDATGNGTLGAPYASINYAYSQVPSLGAPANVTYNAQVGQFVTEKLIFRLAPGRYSENVVLGFKRGRVQLIGNGVQILGSVTMRALRADFPAASMEALKASFPAPYTGAGTLATFELTGEAGGGVESDSTANTLLVTGLTTLLFDEPTVPGSGLGTTWENNYGQFNFYGNKSYLIGGMVVATSYTVPTTNGLPTSVVEVDSCTIGESAITYRSYFGAVPYAYAANPTNWNTGTGVATGAGQSTTSLVDTTKAWTPGQWIGATLSLTTGTGAGQTATVTANTANTLSFAALVTAPVAASTTYSLVGTANKAPTGTITLKAHNSTIGASMGPRITIGEIDGCRLYDLDRTMLGTVDNGGIVGSASTSYLGLVINQFRQYSGTGYPASQYQLGSALSGVRHKIDSTSYTTLAFNRSGAGVLTARTLNLPTSSGTATSGGATTLTDTTKTWNTNQWTGGTITLTGGTGSGQTRTVSSNTATAITVSPAWATNPTAGTTYTVTALVAFDLQDDARSLAYTPTTGANWLDPDPTTVGTALDRVAAIGLFAAIPSNGQIPIGNGTNFTPATLTAGAGVTITNAAGSVTVIGNLSPLGSVGATPTAANLRTNATYTVNVAAVALPAMAAGDDGITISLLNISGAGSTVTPSTGVARTMSTGGGQTWVWRNADTTWYCTSNV